MASVFFTLAAARRTACLALMLWLVGTTPAHASLLGGLLGPHLIGSAHVVSNTRALAHFTGISVEVPAAVELRQGEVERVTVETDDNLQAEIDTSIEGMTLKIRQTNPDATIDTHRLKIIIEARKVRSIELHGTAGFYAAHLHAPSLQLAIGGSGVASIDSLEGDALSASLGGSGTLRIGRGSLKSVAVNIGGSATVEAGKVIADNVRINIGGSGHVTLSARETLTLNAAGSGTVNYYGDPKVTESVIGSASLRRLGPIS